MTATEQEETEQTTEQKNHLVFSSQDKLYEIYENSLLLICLLTSVVCIIGVVIYSIDPEAGNIVAELFFSVFMGMAVYILIIAIIIVVT